MQPEEGIQRSDELKRGRVSSAGVLGRRETCSPGVEVDQERFWWCADGNCSGPDWMRVRYE